MAHATSSGHSGKHRDRVAQRGVSRDAGRSLDCECRRDSGGAGNCTIANLTLDIVEKHNPAQPVDSMLGRYSGGAGTCPYISFESNEVVDYPLAYPLDSMLYGIVDRQSRTDTVLFTVGDNPRRGTSSGYRDADSLVVTLFSFVQNTTGSVVRSIAVARRP